MKNGNGIAWRPALYASAAFFGALTMAGAAAGQTPRPPAAAPATKGSQPAAPVSSAQAPAKRILAPDALGASKLLASMITAVDHANKTGNYSVLLALGSAEFQAGNSAASLGAVFQAFRQRRIDLGDVLVLSPTYTIVPTMIGADRFRMRGEYVLPRGILGFDFIFQWDGGWRLAAISLLPPAR